MSDKVLASVAAALLASFTIWMVAFELRLRVKTDVAQKVNLALILTFTAIAIGAMLWKATG